MWLMTTRGFYSAVQKPEDRKDDLITIRARTKEHLENLADVMPDLEQYVTAATEDEVFTIPKHISGHDYPWRIRVPHAAWDEAVKALSADIDYDNFKSAVGRRDGHSKYERALHKVWSDMLAVETDKHGIYSH